MKKILSLALLLAGCNQQTNGVAVVRPNETAVCLNGTVYVRVNDLPGAFLAADEKGHSVKC